MSATFRFLKGHGTENDFVLLPDPDGTVHGDLDPALVSALCDRRSGIGADGVLRAVRCASSDDPDAVAARDSAEWFMDYRNSDGTVAEMCGNGARVFARFLVDHGYATGPELEFGTRAGVTRAVVGDEVAVSMRLHDRRGSGRTPGPRFRTSPRASRRSSGSP